MSSFFDVMKAKYHGRPVPPPAPRVTTVPPPRPATGTATLYKRIPCKSCANEGRPNVMCFSRDTLVEIYQGHPTNVIAMRATYACERGRHIFDVRRDGVRRILREDSRAWLLGP